MILVKCEEQEVIQSEQYVSLWTANMVGGVNIVFCFTLSVFLLANNVIVDGTGI
jgi:hypothetical protein